ncbi:hypothetical protein ACFL21_04235 [Patescibacteria group bacterium]
MNITTKSRIISYDLYRGILLIAMVIFHVAANLSRIPFNHELFYWIPAGYTLFLGVILGQFLKKRSKKCFKLGIKLLILFLIPNLIILIKNPEHLLQLFPGNIEIFSFEILLPMSIITFLTIPSQKIPSKIIPFFLGTLLMATLALDILNINYYNLSFIIYGLIGYSAAISWNLDNQFKKFQELFIIFFSIITIGIFWYTSKYGISHFLITLQCFTIYFALKLTLKTKFLTKIGADSLFLYIAHIVIIKIISEWFILENLIEITLIGTLILLISIFAHNIFRKTLIFLAKLKKSEIPSIELER